MKITLQQKQALAEQFDVSLPMLQAFLEVESAGSGFFTDWNGQSRVKIQFEPHWFRHYTGKRIPNGVEAQYKEWEAFNEAAVVSLEAAMLSTSWGMGQVMGFNYKLAGFASVHAMVDAFKKSEYEQVKGMLNFCKNRRGLMEAIRGLNWHRAAELYNGSNYAAGEYHLKLAKAYSKYFKHHRAVA